MTRFERIAAWSAGIYLVMAVVTFGHAAAHHPPCIETERKYCPEDGKALAGMGAAILWPFYWSWEAWA